MASNFSTFFGTSGDVENAPAHPDYSWLPKCSADSVVILNPACRSCSQLYNHKLPWRSKNNAPIPDAQRWPTAEFFAKLIALCESLEFYGGGIIDPGGVTTDGINRFLNYPPSPSLVIVSGSGQNLTVESNFHPLNFSYYQEAVENQNWVPGSETETRFLNLERKTRVQVGDFVDFTGGGSVLAGKIVCRVTTPPSSASSGSTLTYRWTMGVSANVGSAAIIRPDWPLEYGLVNIARYSARPSQWGEPMRGASQEVRRQRRIILPAAIEAASDGEVELLNTDGTSTAIAYPRVATDEWQGSVRVIAEYPTLDPPVEFDITAQTINEGRWRSVHNGAATRTFLSCADVVNGVSGFTPLLVSELGRIIVEYDAVATGSDPTTTKRSCGGFRCHHSKLSPDGRFFCALASSRSISYVPPPAAVVHTPPSGVDDYRADNVGVGCYQWQTGAVAGDGTCDQFTPTLAFDYAKQSSFFWQQVWAGVPAQIVQLAPGIADLSNFRVERPLVPGGVPGILFQLGLNLSEVSPGISHPSRDVLGGTRWRRFATDGDGMLVSWNGPLFRNPTSVQPEWDNPATWQPEGILGYESTGGHVSGLGTEFDDENDHGGGVRMNRPHHTAELAIGYYGTTAGATERQTQRCDRDRWFAAPQTSLFLGAEGASVEQNTTGDLGVTVLPSSGDPLVAGDVKLRVIRRGSWDGAAKVGGVIFGADIDTFVDGDNDLIAIEFEPTAVPIGFAAIEPQTSVQGGNIVASSSRFNARDYANANQNLAGAKPLIGAQPGDFVTISVFDTGNPVTDAALLAMFDGRGFCVVKGKAFGGSSRTPDYPEGWPRAADVPYERGDVVWVRDENGLLADHLASMTGASALVATNGTFSPLETLTVEYARVTPFSEIGSGLQEGDVEPLIGDEAWTAVDPSDIADVNRLAGTVTIDAGFLDLELRINPESGDPPDVDDRLICWRVTCGYLTRELRADIRIVDDTIAAMEKVAHTLSIQATSGIPGGIIQVFQRLDRRTGDWGITMEDVRRANLPEVIPGLSTFIVGGDVEYDEDANPYEELLTPRSECVDGYWIPDHGVAQYSRLDFGSGIGQHIRATSYSLGVGGGLVVPQSDIVKAYSEITWGSGFRINWGPLARLPQGTSIVNARASIKFQGLRTLQVKTRVYSNGDGTFSAEVIEGGTVVEGTSGVRLGIGASFVDDRGLEFVKLIGSGIALPTTNDAWATITITDAMQTLLSSGRDSKYYDVFFVALGDGPNPNENAPEALLGEILPPTYNVNPFLAACSMSDPPVPVTNPQFYEAPDEMNPSAGGLDMEVDGYVTEWSNVEVGPEVQVEIQLPSDPTGGVGYLFNAEYSHNSPADESVVP